MKPMRVHRDWFNSKEDCEASEGQTCEEIEGYWYATCPEGWYTFGAWNGWTCRAHCPEGMETSYYGGSCKRDWYTRPY